MCAVATTPNVPVIDLGSIRPDELTEMFHTIGFVVVTGHGVAADVVGDVFAMMERFFALPEADKLRIDKTASEWFRGWEPVGTEYTNNRVDVREQIDIWSEHHPVASVVHPWDRLHGPNQWMPDDLLPGHRAVSLRFMGELACVADAVLRLLSTGLGLEPDHLVSRFGDAPMSLAKFIHYPPTPPGGAGVNAHHDTGFVTVLAAGDTPGLEVEHPEGGWLRVPTVPGGFVINIGEMLQAMTGNYLIATPHRVVATDERLSAAYFHGPSLAMELTPVDLAPRFAARVEASPRHRDAGYMALRGQTDRGVGEMESTHVARTYGEQLWNYFVRSYPRHPTVVAANGPGEPADPADIVGSRSLVE